ncbi:MAG: hypothetical protein UT50_C0015G0010 [Candidatus Moranbacteria bacterium GW2011_GWA2_39_41]|nr:MAG: hypothetical protein UT50_C0015G0010 [Candidatus Moranbacteria bacterium GW2011_GWA2_39_41]
MNKIQTKLNKLAKQAKLQISAYFSDFSGKANQLMEDFNKSLMPGKLDWVQMRIVVLMGLIIFVGYVVLVKQYYRENLLPKISYAQQGPVRETKKEILQKDLTALVKGHPIEEMIPFISQKDRKTAAYIIGIAKKESAWGERKPVLKGEDCYNYWGFRAKRERMGSGGHTCFDTPKEAVDAVTTRIEQIIERNDAQSAKDMIVWKCGSDCSVTGGQAAANKWITDVDMYAKKVLN